MQIKLDTKNIENYLKLSSIINYDNKLIKDLANKIKLRSFNKLELIKNSFEYVRDNIGHSADIDGHIVTCIASDVLKQKEGICYAKSHLLAALLRYHGIPTGFCYQRLILDKEKAPYLIIHGLNAVYIADLNKWIRLDARGNKEGVNAQFSLDDEKLAFPIDKTQGEEDIMVVFNKPDENVIQALNQNHTVEELFCNLPTELKKRY